MIRPAPSAHIGLAMSDDALAVELSQLRHRLESARPFNIGFPGASDFDYTPLADLLACELLNKHR